MFRILFVCHGNICRSPMAEFVMKQKVEQLGLSAQFEIASAATSREEIGNPVYPPVRRLLGSLGISCAGKYARQMDAGDYRKYDLLIGMDIGNIRGMKRICGGDPENKMYRLMSFAGEERDVADPWYSGDFETAYADILAGVSALLESRAAAR